MESGLKFGDLPSTTMHVCVDMQRMFADATEWEMPWMERVLPNVIKLVSVAPERTIFTRFVTAQTAGQGQGTWKRYYQRWSSMTQDVLGVNMLELMPELATFVPPATIQDKHVYAPWMETDLHRQLRARGANTLIISGGETEVCVLATVFGAIDLGYRVVLAADALCSSADETHEAMMRIYTSRFGMQVELCETEEILDAWRHSLSRTMM